MNAVNQDLKAVKQVAGCHLVGPDDRRALVASLSRLQDVLCEADCWMDALRAPDDAPRWTYAIACLLDRVKDAAESVDEAARAAVGGHHV